MPLRYLNRSNSSTTILAGNSVLFNGSNQYLSIANNAAFDFGTGSFTIEGWINPTLIDGTYRCVFSIGNPVQIYARSGTLEIYFNDSDDTLTYIVFGANGPLNAITANTWAHFAVVRNGTTFTAYINGVAGTPTTGVSAAVASSSTGVVIGNILNLYPFSGYISNLRILNGTALYTSNFTPSTSPLTAIANTSLLTCKSVTIVDNSTNNFTITNNGAATVSSTVPFTASFAPAPSGMKFGNRNNSGAPVPTGKSVQFNGSNQYLSVARILDNSTDVTIEAWVRATSTPNSAYIVSQYVPGAADRTIFYILSTLAVGIQIGSAYVESTTTMTLNTWCHVAWVRSGSGANNFSIYINGVRDGQMTYTGTFHNTPTTIGGSNNADVYGNSYFPGYISNLRILKGTALYTSNFTPPTAPLTAIANTSLLTCNADTIIDGSTNNFTITNNNTATVSSITPFTVASAASTTRVRKVYADAVSSIVTSGLVLNLDASNISSYPGSGTSWFDLSGNGNNGTLYNGPTYTGSFGGIIVFDGVDDYFQANVNTATLDGDPSLSVDMFVRRRTGTNIGGDNGFWGIGGMGQGNSIEGWTPTANLIHLDIYDSTRIATAAYYPENQFVHICWTKNGAGTETTNVKCYINGSEVALTKTRTATRANQFNTSTSGKGICLGRINADAAVHHAPIDIGTFKVYSRALLSNEVLQNYNVTRARFGL